MGGPGSSIPITNATPSTGCNGGTGGFAAQFSRSLPTLSYGSGGHGSYNTLSTQRYNVGAPALGYELTLRTTSYTWSPPPGSVGLYQISGRSFSELTAQPDTAITYSHFYGDTTYGGQDEALAYANAVAAVSYTHLTLPTKA